MPGVDFKVKIGLTNTTAFDVAKAYEKPEVIKLLAPHYMTLKGKSLEAVKKYRGQQIPEEQIQKKLPQELQEEL